MPCRTFCKAFQRRTRFAQALRAFALLVLSGSNRQRQMRPEAAFCMWPDRPESWLSAARTHTEMPHLAVRHLPLRLHSAERTRFELVIRLPVCRFSKPVDSATLPPLQSYPSVGFQTWNSPCWDDKVTTISLFCNYFLGYMSNRRMKSL